MNQNLMQLLNSNMNLVNRAKQMTQGKTPAEIQQIALNLCKERGLDFQSVLQQFQSQYMK